MLVVLLFPTRLNSTHAHLLVLLHRQTISENRHRRRGPARQSRNAATDGVIERRLD